MDLFKPDPNYERVNKPRITGSVIKSRHFPPNEAESAAGGQVAAAY